MVDVKSFRQYLHDILLPAMHICCSISDFLTQALHSLHFVISTIREVFVFAVFGEEERVAFGCDEEDGFEVFSSEVNSLILACIQSICLYADFNFCSN